MWVADTRIWIRYGFIVIQMDYLVTDEYQLMAIYDGHGSAAVSNYLKCNLLRLLSQHNSLKLDFNRSVQETFRDIEEEILADPLLDNYSSGSTAIVVLLTEDMVSVANLGDSRAILINHHGQPYQVNVEHNLINQNERQAVAERGGIIIKKGKQYRVNGEINISRSFGDGRLKPFLSSIPEVNEMPRHLFRSLVVASDGFWENTTNQCVTDIISSNNHGLRGLARNLYNKCSPKANDNTSIICVELD
jgi:serine/threonine protein phosphatase PrpC